MCINIYWSNHHENQQKFQIYYIFLNFVYNALTTLDIQNVII